MAASLPTLLYMLDFDLIANLTVAALAGLAIGAEREWSGHTQGPDARFAGVRTFFLLGGIGGVAGLLLAHQLLWAGAAVLAGAGALIVTAYALAVRRPGSSTDGTTEAAALAVLTVGVMAGLGWRAMASGATAIMAVVLLEKSRAHALLRRVDEREMRAALQFAVLALVVLPLIPEGTYGPYGAFRPRELWIVVLLFSGLNFLGYVARQVVGNERGYGVTGLLGGLVSSTAVTLHFSRQSRSEPVYAAPLGLGVIAACTVLVPRVFLVSMVLEPPVGAALIPFLVPPFAVGALYIGLVLWRARRSGPDDPESNPTLPAPESHETRNPLGLWRSVQMGIAFQAVLLLMAWITATVGMPGVLASAAVLGLTDMDALTLSMTRVGSDAALRQLAALAIAVGLLSNTLLKLTLTLVLGARTFQKRASLGLVALGAASAVGIALGMWRDGTGFFAP
jgi:uncharacterized membrane protein (DUF4010 family)